MKYKRLVVKEIVVKQIVLKQEGCNSWRVASFLFCLDEGFTIWECKLWE